MRPTAALLLLALAACSESEMSVEPLDSADDTVDVALPEAPPDRPEDDPSGGVTLTENDAPLSGWVGSVEAMVRREAPQQSDGARGHEENDGCVGTFVLDREDAWVDGAAGCSSRDLELDVVGTLSGRLIDGQIDLVWDIELWGTPLRARATGEAGASLTLEIEAEADDLVLMAVMRGDATY